MTEDLSGSSNDNNELVIFEGIPLSILACRSKQATGNMSVSIPKQSLKY